MRSASRLTRSEFIEPVPSRGIVLALLLAAGACSGMGGTGQGGGAVDDPFSGQGSGGTVRLVVQNDNSNPAELVALTSTGQLRLGVVRSRDQGFFNWTISGETEVAIGIRLRNGESHRTNTVRAQPGDQLRLRISRILTSSSLRR